MGWFSKKLKKITKVVDPIGAKLRKSTGGSYGDPMNWYQSKPKAVVPYQRPERPGLQADPGTAGPTMNLGGGGTYTPNPFAGQMAQASALRQPNMAAPPSSPMPQGMSAPGSVASQQMQMGMVRGARPPGMMF
jgi:hypothetical protein